MSHDYGNLVIYDTWMKMQKQFECLSERFQAIHKSPVTGMIQTPTSSKMSFELCKVSDLA